MKKRNSFPLSLNLDLLKQLTQPCTVNRPHHHADQECRMTQRGCPTANQCLLVLTGMGSDLLGIGGDLGDLPTHLLSSGQGCQQISGERTSLDTKNFRDKPKREGEEREKELLLPCLSLTISSQSIENDLRATRDAKAAMDKEWKKLTDKGCWLEDKVREFPDVQREAQHQKHKLHIGRIFEIGSQKGSELPKGHPDEKWKGRSVFQGNKVSDENDDLAIFAELGSSPASMEAAKIIDVFESQPGYSKQQADARQAYTQALFTGIETWVRLPRNRWPKEWNGMKDPDCPLRLALYGHPDSGGIWKQRFSKQLGTVGWVAVLPEIWQSIFYHAELDLLLVVYVDDFKMAGPEANLAEGWKGISSVIDMDPPEPFGRYFGCHHFEKTGVRLPREAHPFAYVFDKKHAAAAQGNLEPPRTKDDWEVDPEVGAVIRHHVYPRKKLYLTTEADIKQYPTLQPICATEPEDEEDSTLDNPNQNPRGKKDKWWTGQTCFPLIEVDPEEFRMALAARKGPPKRSKAEAKRKASSTAQRPFRRNPFHVCPSLST